MISIIIPTLNEEDYLPGLLDSIKEQEYDDLEIIVSDAGSRDKTKEIAESFGCNLVKGGLPGVGKNNGAKDAIGETLIFLDADMKLSKNELKNAIKEFNFRNLDVASSQLCCLEKDFFGNLALHLFYNFPVIILENILQHGAGFIMIKKEMFNELKGFDEQILLEEDQDLIRRAAKKGNFRILRSIKPYFSLRRFKQDGYIRTYSKYLASEAYNLIFGPDRKQMFKYKFDHYEKQQSAKEQVKNQK